MFKLKSCPRCSGDLIIEQAHQDRSEYCLQCGFRRDFRITTDLIKNNIEMAMSNHHIG
jgi:ribosomal protein S27AE